MAIRTSEGRYLEVLEPGALVNLPIEVDVYDGGSPATMIATLERAQDVALQVHLSELGAGRFALARSDPKATPAILAKGNLVKIKTGGKYRGAWWIEEPEEILTSTAEGGGELVKVAGRGALAYLEQAIVYPPVWPVVPAVFRSATNATNATAGATTITIAKPAGVTSGDVIIAAIGFVGGYDKVISPPTGWKEIRREDNGNALGVAYYRKAAGSSEPASYKWAFTTTTKAVGNLIAVRNVTSDFTQYSFASQTKGTGTAITNPSVDIPTVDGILLTISAATEGVGMTPPATFTEAADDHSESTTRVMESAYLAAPALGPTGDLTTTNTTSSPWIGATLFLPSSASLDVVFGGDTPGAIMKTLIDRAQARGALDAMTYDFDGATDSAGQPWPDTFELTFHAGTTLLDVWRQLVALGMEGEMSFDLRLSTYVDRTRDKTQDVILRKGYHLRGDVAKTAHLSGIRTRLLVEGAGGRIIEVGPSSLETDPKIHRREGFLSMATSDAATDLARAGSKSLELSELEDGAQTLPVTHGLLTVGQYEPWEDYRPGDRIGVDGAGTGEYTEERVVGITIAQAGPLDYEVTLNLNSVFLEAAIRMRRELDALAGTGARSSGASSLGLGAGTGQGAGAAAAGLVMANPGDTAGYLLDKLGVASPKLTKALGGVAGNRIVELDVDVAELGTGTPTPATFLRGDGAWATPVVGGNRYSPDNAPVSGVTWADEFDAGSLDPAWSWDTPPSVTDLATFPSFLHIRDSISHGATYYKLRRAFAPGGTAFAIASSFAIASQFNANETFQLGIAALDGSDNVLSAVTLVDSGASTRVLAQRLSGTGAGTTALFGGGVSTRTYLLLTRSAGGVYKGYWSFDGVTWIYFTTNTTATAVAKVAILEISGGTTEKRLSADFVRVFDSETQKIGS